MHIFKLLPVLALTIILFSCEKEEEGFHQITGIESQVHNQINQYRESNGMNKIVSQYIMFKEARIHSQKMANDLVATDGTGINERFNVVKEKIGGTDTGYIILTCDYYIADSIVNKMLSFQENLDVIEQNYTQSGVGIVHDDKGKVFVTHMFLNIPPRN